MGRKTSSIDLIKSASVLLMLILAVYLSYRLVNIEETSTVNDVGCYIAPALVDKMRSTSPNKYNLPLNGDEKSIRMMFFGDMMIDRHVGEKIRVNGLEYIFGDVSVIGQDEKDDYDIIGCNLEGVVSNNGAHYPPEMAYDFAFSPELIGKLSDYGFNFFNLSNNHILDQGRQGIIETRKNLNDMGYLFSGSQDGEISEYSATTTLINGYKVALVGFSMVYSRLDDELLSKTIGTLAQENDVLIVNIHWGVEYEHKNNILQEQTAHTLIDYGADMVIGHHPHVVEGMEFYKGKPIFYSLGNYVFDQYFSADTQEGLSISLIIKPDSMEIELLPFKSIASQITAMTDAEKTQFLEKFISWSKLDDKISEQISSGKIIY